MYIIYTFFYLGMLRNKDETHMQETVRTTLTHYTQVHYSFSQLPTWTEPWLLKKMTILTNHNKTNACLREKTTIKSHMKLKLNQPKLRCLSQCLWYGCFLGITTKKRSHDLSFRFTARDCLVMWTFFPLTCHFLL